MHRCLRLSEILYNILENLSEPRNLLSGALVSKNFCEPALDVLWVFQQSFLLLFKTFPPDLWTERGSARVLTFQRILTQSDFDRFLFYGKKMRTLRTLNKAPNILSQIDSSVLHMTAIFLDQFYPQRVVMPRLHEFTCQFNPFHSSWDVIPFLSPSLRRIEVDITSSSDESASTFLSTLAVKSPLVQQITINCFSNATAHFPPISGTFPCGYLHLSTFRCPHFQIDYNTIGCLARLPQLCDVSLYCSGTNSGHRSMPAMPPQPFPSLRHLALTGPRFISGIEFIQTFLHSDSLNSIDVLAGNPPYTGELYQLFSALSSHLSLQVLTSASLHRRNHDDEDEVGPALEPSEFEPLLQFNNLESLYLETVISPEHISDSLMAAMSLAWPQLTTLRLDSRLFFVPPSKCTFEGIFHLAKHCPRLSFLGIPFMASSKIDLDSRSRAVPVNRNLKYLDVGRSPIDDVELVASLLSVIFPNIIAIWAWDGFDDDDDEEEAENYQRWQEVIHQNMTNR